MKYEKGSGRTNTVEYGHMFRVCLPEDHGKGYTWSLNQDFDPDIVTYMNSLYHSTDGGMVDFNFKAERAGKTEITFVLRMHTDTALIKTYEIEVLK